MGNESLFSLLLLPVPEKSIANILTPYFRNGCCRPPLRIVKCDITAVPKINDLPVYSHRIVALHVGFDNEGIISAEVRIPEDLKPDQTSKKGVWQMVTLQLPSPGSFCRGSFPASQNF